MARPFEELPNIMERYARGTGQAIDVLIRDLATKAGRAAVENTRVDTGLARSNWRASLDVPAVGVIPPYAPGSKLGIGEGANAAGAINQQQSVIRAFTTKRNKSIHLTNNVDYIGVLNNGGPNVSPAMMAQRAVQEAQARARGTRILKKSRT